MATLVDTAAALDLNKDDAAELKRQRLRDKKRRQRQKQKEKKKCLTERRDTENKGQGLFATQSIEEGSTVARQPPALSVVFDAHSQTVCGFCFRPVRISASRGVETPPRHRRDSCPSDDVVGGFFVDFEAIRTEYAPRRTRRTRGPFLL